MFIDRSKDKPLNYMLTTGFVSLSFQCMSFANFLSENIFDTKDRTGILIYISEVEHEVVVLADKGIYSKTEDKEWQSIVKTIVQGIKTKSVADSIVEAIDKCKIILLNHGFNVTKNDTNELPDDIRIEEH